MTTSSMSEKSCARRRAAGPGGTRVGHELAGKMAGDLPPRETGTSSMPPAPGTPGRRQVFQPPPLPRVMTAGAPAEQLSGACRRTGRGLELALLVLP
jgi:hypothetical protein